MNTKSSQTQTRWTWWRKTLLALNVLALVLSGILSEHYLKGGSLIGCSGEGTCDQVLNSPWSMIAGVIPVSGLAFGAYLAMAVAIFFIGSATESSVRRIAWSALMVLAGSISGAAVWFIIVQKFIIGSFCLYCMTTHIIGLLMAAFIVWKSLYEVELFSNNFLLKNIAVVQKIFPHIQQRSITYLRIFGMTLIGIILTGIMAIAQINTIPSNMYEDGNSQFNISAFDYKNVPMVGSPDAPYIVTLLFDYQCPHCQQIHFMLQEAVHRYNGKLAFVLCPAPLNTQCNPYVVRDVEAFTNSCELAKVGLAVWSAKREAYPAFEEWMFSFESGDRWHPRTLEAATKKAMELVGKENYDAVWNNPWSRQYLHTCVQIYGQTSQNGKGGIPKLIYGSRWVIPEPHYVDGLIIILQKSLGMPKP